MTRINMTEAGLERGKARKIDNNTWRHRDSNGVEHIRLHHTDIITFLDNDRMKLDSGGYKTITTKDRWNKFLRGYRIYSNRGMLYVSRGEKEIPFEDGMILPDAFAAPVKVSPDIALRKKVNKFVAKLDKFDHFPMPELGDCFFCQALIGTPQLQNTKVGVGKLVNGKLEIEPTTAGMGGDPHHCLQSHVDEGYMHGSLVIRAMQASHYGNLGFVVELARRDWPHWKTQIKRNVRRFVCREIGLAT